MDSQILAIYDEDTVYAIRLQAFLSNQKGNPFTVCVFTNREDLFAAYIEKDTKCNIKAPEILLVAESCFDEKLSLIGAKCMFVLNETGLKKFSQYVNFNKYQSASILFKQILLEYVSLQKNVISPFFGEKMAKLIGIYTPARSVLQTSYGIALSQVLGKKGRTLYINFEQFSGFSKLFQKKYLKDLSDLVYFYTYSKDKFLYWLEGVVESFRDMDYVPPVLTAVSLVSVSSEIWVEMIRLICRESGYEYVVLDLSDSIQDVFSILGICDVVYTLSKADVVSKAKMSQFEQRLEEQQYNQIRDKIHKIKLPVFAIKDKNWEEIVYGELYEFVVKMVSEDFDLGDIYG